MLLHSVQCPNCKSTLSSKSGVPAGQKLNCPKCKSPFVAGAPAEDFEVVDETDVIEDVDEVVDEPAPKKKSAPAKRRSRDDDETETTTRSSRRRSDDDDVDDTEKVPMRARRRHDEDDDDDEDDRPRRKKGRKEKSGYQKLKENLWVRIGTMVVLLAIMGVLLYFYLDKRKKDREAEEHNQRIAAGVGNGADGQDDDAQIAARQELRRRLAGVWDLDEGANNAGSPPLQLRIRADGEVRAVHQEGGEAIGSLELSHVNKGSDSAQVILRFTYGKAMTFVGPMECRLTNSMRKLELVSTDKKMSGYFTRSQ